MHSPERPHHFNPRPPRGGRLVVHQQLRHQLVQFQSTPPARGTTTHQLPDAARPPISIHAPREGDDFVDGASRQYRYISIHAPREGDDPMAGEKNFENRLFQSTPPARGTTWDRLKDFGVERYFNPRPPRGGRRDHPSEPGSCSCNFNPRPPRGGRQQRCTVLPADL